MSLSISLLCKHNFCYCVTFVLKSKIIKSCTLIMNPPHCLRTTALVILIIIKGAGTSSVAKSLLLAERGLRIYCTSYHTEITQFRIEIGCRPKSKLNKLTQINSPLNITVCIPMRLQRNELKTRKLKILPSSSQDPCKRL